MKKYVSILLVCAVTASVVVKAQAQFPAEELKSMLIKDWERAKAYTNEYLDRMPANRYGAYAVDSIRRSFGQQMLHLASANFGLASAAIAGARPYTGFDMEHSAGAQGRDSVAYYVNASYDYVINGLKNLDASRLSEHVKQWNRDESRFWWINKAFEHQTHHRGQCTIYIRLQGVRPPEEKLF